MNHLLLKHRSSDLFTVPEGLRELMSDITREVLREQPKKIFPFISNYLSVLLITRENGMIAVKILDDLCDCRPFVTDHLIQLGLSKSTAELLAQAIKLEVETEVPVPEQENTQEMFIVKRVLSVAHLDEEMFSKVSQITIDAYREYWYKKKALEKSLEIDTDEPWEIAVQRTLDIYKSTKPSMTELNRAAEKIETAYRHYHNQRRMLQHLLVKSKLSVAEKEKPKPKLDIFVRQFDSKVDVQLGSMLCIKSREDLTQERHITSKITHILNDEEDNVVEEAPKAKTIKIGKKPTKTFKFEEPNEEDVTVSYTQVDIVPQFGKTEQNLGSLIQPGGASTIAKRITDGAGDNEEIIPEVITSIDDYDEENDDYDIPEDFSDTDSGPSSHVPATALEALISDIEEDIK